MGTFKVTINKWYGSDRSLVHHWHDSNPAVYGEALVVFLVRNIVFIQ